VREWGEIVAGGIELCGSDPVGLYPRQPD